MTAFFISILAVLIALALLSNSATDQANRSSRRWSFQTLLPALSVGTFVCTSAICIANQQTTTPDPPQKPAAKIPAPGSTSAAAASQDGTQQTEGTAARTSKDGASIEVIIKTDKDSKSITTQGGPKSDAAEPAEATDSSDIFFVITKEGLNKLISASGGDIEAFDVQTLKQASALMPLSLSQSRALSPVLRTAASPIMLKQLFDPTNLKVIQELLQNSSVKPKGPTEIPPIDYQAWNLFLLENSWIENPGIGQLVTQTGMVEADRPEEIAREVELAIRNAVAERVQKLAADKYGPSKRNGWQIDTSTFDASQAIAQTAQWQEQVSETGDPDDVMVRTHILVDLPAKEIDLLMRGVKTELQKERLVAVGITIGLFWFGIALSSIAFRTYHSKSRIWKLVVIPALFLAVIPCFVGAALMVGEMYSGSVF